MTTEKRKAEHIEIALRKNVQFKSKTTEFEKIRLEYDCIPDFDLSETNLSTTFLGKNFFAPLMVSAITGGAKNAREINRDIAKACQKLGIGMGLGSQRAMLEDSSLTDTYQVRDVAPDIFLAGNIGITQLKNYSVKQIEKALSDIKADALAVHLNAAQEAVQPDGTPNFNGALSALKALSRKLSKPVYVKEVGHGIGRNAAKKLAGTGIKAIDVQGAGGTSWVAIDSLRGNKGLGEAFWDFGIPTAVSVFECRQAFKGPIIASGGVRSGLDVVKGLILGANLAGIALPVLKAQSLGGAKGVEKYLQEIIDETRIAMFLLNAKSIKDLKKTKYT